jgi:hypothetical protein
MHGGLRAHGLERPQVGPPLRALRVAAAVVGQTRSSLHLGLSVPPELFLAHQPPSEAVIAEIVDGVFCRSSRPASR